MGTFVEEPEKAGEPLIERNRWRHPEAIAHRPVDAAELDVFRDDTLVHDRDLDAKRSCHGVDDAIDGDRRA
jgi:hypothetical protein